MEQGGFISGGEDACGLCQIGGEATVLAVGFPLENWISCSSVEVLVVL
jgi:hypothetical protein